VGYIFISYHTILSFYPWLFKLLRRFKTGMEKNTAPIHTVQPRVSDPLSELTFFSPKAPLQTPV